MGDFLPPMRCPTEEDEYLFKLNKFHLTMPMAHYGNRPILVGVNIQKKCSDFHKREHRARLHHIIASNFTSVKYGLLESQLRSTNIVILFYSAKYF